MFILSCFVFIFFLVNEQQKMPPVKTAKRKPVVKRTAKAKTESFIKKISSPTLALEAQLPLSTQGPSTIDALRAAIQQEEQDLEVQKARHLMHIRELRKMATKPKKRKVVVRKPMRHLPGKKPFKAMLKSARRVPMLAKRR